MYKLEKRIKMLKKIRQKYIDNFPLDKSLLLIDLCKQLFESHPDSFSLILVVGYTLYELDKQYIPPFKYLVDWINEQTPLLQDSIYGFGTKLHWIFRGLTDFPVCMNPNCSNKIGIGLNVRVNRGYPEYCCNSCAQSDERIIKRGKATKFRNHGDENYVNIEKIKQHNLEAYGYEYTFQVPDIIKKCKQTKNKHIEENPNYWKDRQLKSEQTRIMNGHDPHWINADKAQETRRNNLANDPHYYDESKRKSIEMKRQKYGKSLCDLSKTRATIQKHKDEDPLYLQKINAKSRATRKKNYGDEKYMYFGSKSFYSLMLSRHGDPYWNNPEKNKQTCMERYGTPMYMAYGSKQFKDRMIELYGVEHNSQVYKFRIKQQLKMIYDSICFGSSWELALYIWLKDHNVTFKYLPDVDIWYEFDGKKHKYAPDFMINGLLVEIKGNHFFDNNGLMRCPYRKKTWTDEQYEHKCAQYEAKHQCMIEHNVQIMLGEDCKKYIDYVELTYGKGYLNQFKKKPKEGKISNNYDKTENNK